MNVRTQIFVIIVVVGALIALVNLVRKNKVELKYALLWFFLGLGILLFACIPILTEKLAVFLGIGLPINLLIFVGFCLSLIIIFSLSVAVSHLSEKVNRLTQELGLLKKEVTDLKEEN